MSNPTDILLYNKTKKKIYKKYPTHSAYRSGMLVKTYKNTFLKKYPNKDPYIGYKKNNSLKRWFNEKWKNQRSGIGYKYKSDVYRPTVRINNKTPNTFNELTNTQIKKARTFKYKFNIVSKFNIHTIKMFKDYPDFKPNISPKEMFELGSFGGTYWRPIYSGILKKNLKNYHKKYKWFNKIADKKLSSTDYDININNYKVKVGTSLKFWEEKKWINKLHPYGWVHWYCDFYKGLRCEDDERQIKRWKKIAGTNGRFMRFLVTQILKNKKRYDDISVSPKIRQVLQHWGYVLTKEDYEFEIKRRKKI
tara:strand:- start:368 stop:1285 length:918 start_codon:yes stop_codon:yes gene_type:complete